MADKEIEPNDGIKRVADNSEPISKKKLYTYRQENFNQFPDLLPEASEPQEQAKHRIKRIISDIESLMQLLETIGYRPTTIYTSKFPKCLLDIDRSFKLLSLELDDKLGEFIIRNERE